MVFDEVSSKLSYNLLASAILTVLNQASFKIYMNIFYKEIITSSADGRRLGVKWRIFLIRMHAELGTWSGKIKTPLIIFE